jgi:tRNA/rRNA methyltransferase
MPDQKPTKRRVSQLTTEPAPVVVLVEPSLPENVGMAARAMLNFGLTELRLVRCQFDWPSAKAINASSGAHFVLENAQHYQNTEDAVADLQRLSATTARLRDMVKHVQSPREWSDDIRSAVNILNQRAGILFGPERVGLNNDDLALADTLVNVPTNPAFSSINLAQTVLLLGYEWRLSGQVETPENLFRKGYGGELASQQDIIAFYRHLEDELDKSGFLRVPEKRPRMVRNIRNIFNRIKLTDQEVRTLRGVIVALAEKKHQPQGESRRRKARNDNR